MISNSGTSTLGLYDFKRKIDAFGGVDDNTVESVAEMLAIANPVNGTRIYVKGYRAPTLFVEANPFKGGGTFIYDSSKSSVNDGGVIINGWVRQITDHVTPCMFGAYADDSTNDGQYIQSSLTSAIANKLSLDFEGRYYCVKKENYTSDVLQHIFSIDGDIEIIGNGASVRIDQSTAPAASKIMTLFRPFRKPEDATNYSKSIGRIHIHGFDFDGGFNYDVESDYTTVTDVKKCFFFYGFEVIYDELKINANRFSRFAQQNVIAVGFSPSFKTYGISKKTTISDNLFYDNGLDADMSTLYIMSKEITIDGANKFEQPKGREKHCRCAMELHGTGAVVTGNFFTNTNAWVNFAVNEIEETVGQFVFSNNVGEALQAVGNIWSGESTDEAQLSEIICTNNTVRFIDSPDFNFTNINRNLLGTGGFNKSLQSLIVSNNTCKVDSLTDATPVYFLDIAVQLDWISDLFNLSVLGNTGYNMTGFAVIGRLITQNIDNCFIRNITIGSNSIFNTADAYIKAVTINQINDPTAFVSNLNVFGNTISSNYNKVAWFIKGTGNIGNVDIGLNTYNNKPVSTDAIIFDIKPNRISTTQSRNHVEYGDINPTKNPHIESVKREYLQLRVNLSELFITGTNGYLSAGVLYSGVRLKAIRTKMSVGVSKLVEGDILNTSMYASSVISDSVSVLNRATPSVSFKLNAESEFPLTSNEFFSLLFSTNKAEYLNTLKASGGNVLFEFEIEKLL